MTSHDKFRQLAENLQTLAERYHRFKEHPDRFLEHIHELGEDQLETYRDNISTSITTETGGVRQIRPVVFLRGVIIDRIVGGDTVTPSDVETIQAHIDDRDATFFGAYPQLHDPIANQKDRKRSAFQAWNLFRILHGIDFWFHASDTNQWLTSIASFLQDSLKLDTCETHLASFNYNQNYGTDLCWIAFYPDYAPRHQEAYQVFFSVRHDRFVQGVIGGSQIVDEPKERERVPEESSVAEGAPIDVEAMLDRYHELLPRFNRLNRELHLGNKNGPSPRSETAGHDRRHPLSQILYGPPGTGKTYSTRRRAVEIIDGIDENRSDTEIAEQFRRHREAGRIEFTTFHPSFAYEEFVEGLRYDVNEKVPVVQEGILKRLAQRAMNPHTNPQRPDSARIWKFSLGRTSNDAIYKRSMEANEIAVGFIHDEDLTGLSCEEIGALFQERGEGEKTSSITCMDYFVNEITDGDYVAIYNDPRTIRAVGVVCGPYTYNASYERYPHVRPVEWIDRSVRDVYELNGSTQMTRQTVYPLERVALEDFLDLVPETVARRRHVLIIDEINRGNLSRIFGELITLLEEDKRKGQPNEVSVRLPYSQDRFTLPSNLYVIGTMNTADRSIALLDTALRRRFHFEEMMPDVDVIRDELLTALDEAGESVAEGDNAESADFDLSAEQIELICQVFQTLNKRIAALLDRDHQIGHSYFLGLRSMQDLRQVWYTRLLPLVQEYFYDDASRLQHLLGAFKPEDRFGFIEMSTPPNFLGNGSLPATNDGWKFHRYRVGELEAALRRTFQSDA